MPFCVHGCEAILRVTRCPLSRSLKTFFNKARDMLYFKRLIQIPKLPDVRAQRAGKRWDDYTHNNLLVLATKWGKLAT